jgi:protocatechuate 3,4-dioxygenase beta subunit
MTRKPINWPRLVFIFVPLLIVVVDAAVLLGEHLQPDTEKAIRLVRESNSRKENFTLQQYLYTTVYHRKANGEPITIEGWRATVTGEQGSPITVEFSYADSAGRYVAIWEANLRKGSVNPKSQAALDLSWH